MGRPSTSNDNAEIFIDTTNADNDMVIVLVLSLRLVPADFKEVIQVVKH